MRSVQQFDADDNWHISPHIFEFQIQFLSMKDVVSPYLQYLRLWCFHLCGQNLKPQDRSRHNQRMGVLKVLLI